MPKTNKEETQLHFQLKAIEILGFELITPSQNIFNSEIVFNFDVQIEHRINVPENVLYILVNVVIQNESKDQIFGNISVGCNFYVENLGGFINSNKAKAEIPQSFINSLNSISISTTRGIMFTQFKGTFLHNAILPIFDPRTFKPLT